MTAGRDAKVVIIGAGPAGLRAAETLAKAGLRPILIDEAPRIGGQIYRQPPVGAERPAKALYGFEAGKATRLHSVLVRCGDRIDHRPETLAWNIFENTIDLLGPDGLTQITFDRLILATGAMDRTLPFPGWTLPGVFTLGAAQIALKAQGVAIGKRVALIGAGPLLPLVVYQYLKAGADVVAALDVTPFAPKIRAVAGLAKMPATLAKGLYYTAVSTLKGRPIVSGVRSVRVEGDTRVEALVWQDAHGREHRATCDAVAASFGLRSETQLTDLAGCKLTFDATTRQWLPQRSTEGRSSRPDVYLAGDGSAIGGADVAELTGERAAWSLVGDLGLGSDKGRVETLDRELGTQRTFRTALEAAYPYPHHIVNGIADDEIVCRCEGVTAGTLRNAAQHRGAEDMNRLKALTRCGMGRCQGRVCGGAAAEILSQTRGCDIADVGRLRTNPPIKPIPISEALK